MNLMLRAGALTAVTAAVALGAVAFATHDPSEAPADRPGLSVITAHGKDRLPAATAADWVTYADHVVVVTPVAEREIAPGQEEIERGEGVIFRDVTLRVDRVLWSRPAPDLPAPPSFSWTAYGWQFTEGSLANRTEMAGDEEPRIESGHSYVMAVEWAEPHCTPGDAQAPGQWRGLGADSTIPFDNGVLGQGESAGTVVSPQPQRAAVVDPSDPHRTLEAQVAGQSAEHLTSVLNSAVPGQRKQIGPPAARTPCG
ncbi:hypothetical protein ACFWIA_05720 [Streptomyces sp. NPDC127068]|uniref:hypothetical protein n=1 Tax=Streptomyces sp. NPDC127068 TaxID=3347127 RepID=UPI00365DA56B